MERLSRHARVYRTRWARNTKYVVRHSVLNDTFILDEPEGLWLLEGVRRGSVEAEDDGRRELLDELREAHILVPYAYEEGSLIEWLARDSSVREPTVSILYLSVTPACNLACDYCFVLGNASADSAQQDWLAEEDEGRITDFLRDWTEDPSVSARLAQHVVLFAYGGEPLLRPTRLGNLIGKVRSVLEETGRTLEVNLVTNGTRFTDEALAVVKAHEIALSVSLDGPPDVHDRHRRHRSGKGSWAAVNQGLERLSREGIPFGLSCTITEENRDVLDSWITEICSRFGVRSFGLNLLLGSGSGSVTSAVVEDNRALQSAFLQCRRLGASEDRLGRKYEAFHAAGQPYWKDCGAFGHQVVFFANGTVGTCQAYLGDSHHVAGQLGRSRARDVLSSRVFREWAQAIPLQRDACLACPALGICGGGCAFDTANELGDIDGINRNFCFHTLESLAFLIKLAVLEVASDEDPTLHGIDRVVTHDVTFLGSG